MTDETPTDSTLDGIDRRTILRTASAAALGVAATGTASAHDGVGSDGTDSSDGHDHADPGQHATSEHAERLDYHSLGAVGPSSNAGRPEEPHYGGVTEVRTHGDYAYVGFFSSDDPTNDRGMAILDISQFTSADSYEDVRDAELSVLSFVRNDDPAAAVMDVKISDDGAYVFLSKQPYTALFDETDPTPGTDGDSTSATAGSVVAVDVRDKGNPEVVGAYTAWTTGSHNAYYHRIGGREYVFACKDLNDGTAGLYVLEFDRDTGQLALVNEVTSDGNLADGETGDGGLNYIHDITIQDDPRTGEPYGYLSYWDQGLYVLDLSDPTSVDVVGRFEMNRCHYSEPAPGLLNGKRVVVAGQETPSVDGGSSGVLYLLDADGVDDGYDGTENVHAMDSWELLSDATFGNFTRSPHNFDVTASGWVHLAHYHDGVRYLEIDGDDWLLRERGHYRPHQDVPEDSKMEGLNSATPFTWGAVEHGGVTFAADINTGVYALRHEHVPLDVDGRANVFAEREDDGPTFTGGQTNQVDVSVATDTTVRVRDEIPAEWTVVGGDPVTTETANGRTTVTFDAPTDGGDRTYFVEAPTGLAETATYEFGPVEYRPAGDDDADWTALPDTTEENAVLGASTAALGALGIAGAAGAVARGRDRLRRLVDRLDDVRDAARAAVQFDDHAATDDIQTDD